MFSDSKLRKTGAVLFCAAAIALLSGCFLIEGPTPETPPRATLELPEDPEFFPDGSAEDNWPYFTYVLDGFAGGERPVTGENVVNAVAEAGFERSAMQVSFDATETGLVADNIFVSVLIGESCLIGQVLTEEREVASEVMPAVGPERDVCLIGDTRDIDWG